mgnify:FL=1
MNEGLGELRVCEAHFCSDIGNFVPHKAKLSGGSHCGGEEVLLRNHARQGIKNDRRMV